MEGYGNVTKGYRLYDATQRKIFHSRDVQFNEQVKHQSWSSTLDAYLKEMQFTQTTSNPCIYFQNSGYSVMFIGVYVDDIILAAKNEKQLKQVKEQLSDKFDIKDLGEFKYFLGMKVEQNKDNGSFWIGQPAYIENLLKRQGMQYMKKAGRKYPEHLADSCKRSSVNRMAAGSRLSWCIRDFFSCLQLFKHTVLT